MPNSTDILSSIAEHLGLFAEDLDPKALLREDLNLGPVELNDLLNFLSKKYQIVFELEDTENLKTVEDLVALVEDNLIA
ncbi:acyl carrier protein [Candidatus Daviesbacteria bacterium]|nr:acyl carrier protein [Candidatus Daviesbacteria bacterium]